MLGIILDMIKEVTMKRDPSIIVLGTGGAGLRAALQLRRAGLPVVAATKGGAGASGSTASGIFSYCCARPGDPSNPPELFRQDILNSGLTVNDPDLVELMCRDGYARLDDLAKMGLPWTRSAEGELAVAWLPGHQVARAFHAGNRIGKAMSDALLRACLQAGVWFEQYQVAMDLLLEGGAVAGVAMLDIMSGEATAWRCDVAVVASGGASAIYYLHTNPPGQTGDGMALLLRAGGELVDMEFMQMYPTVLVHPQAAYGMELPTGRILSQGARLLNRHGEEFFSRWERGPAGKATRDVLARAIAKEVASGGGSEAGGVYLDARHIPEGMERNRYNRYLRELGIDLKESLQQVAPGAHYSLGGIRILRSTACVGVEGAFAGGEVAGGVHGANRLAGNALTETQVFGALAGQGAVDYVSGPRRKGAPCASGVSSPGPDRRTLQRGESAVWDALCAARSRSSGVSLQELQGRLRRAVQGYASVIRTRAGLEKGLAEVAQLRQAFFNHLAVPPSEESWHPELLEAVEMANMLDVAQALLAGALVRTESRGAHYREDYPDRKGDWDGCNLLSKGSGDSLTVHRLDRKSGERKQVWP